MGPLAHFIRCSAPDGVPRPQLSICRPCRNDLTLQGPSKHMNSGRCRACWSAAYRSGPHPAYLPPGKCEFVLLRSAGLRQTQFLEMHGTYCPFPAGRHRSLHFSGTAVPLCALLQTHPKTLLQHAPEGMAAVDGALLSSDPVLQKGFRQCLKVSQSLAVSVAGLLCPLHSGVNCRPGVPC
jgi:hypothetical protein